MLVFNGLFNGPNMGAPEGLRMTSAITMEAWIQPTERAPASSADGVILGKEGEYLLARFEDGTIRWALAAVPSGFSWVSTGYVAPEGEWTHVAVVYDGSEVRTYANGRRVHRVARTGPIGDANPTLNDFQIGSRGAIDQRFSGFIDEVRVWRVARTTPQIREGLHRLLDGNEPGLAGYWRFDEGMGDTVSDLTGNGHHGTRGAGGWRVSTAPVGVPRATTVGAEEVTGGSARFRGELGQENLPAESALEWDVAPMALGLDGRDDEAVIAHRDEMNGDPVSGPYLTVAAWVKVPPGGSGGVVNKYVSGSSNGWQIYVFQGEIRAWYFVSGTRHIWGPTVWTDRRGLNGGRVDDGQWRHVAFQVDATGGNLYVDGSLWARTGWTGASGRPTTTQALRIGSYAGEPVVDDRWLEGAVRDVGLWRTSLPVGAINDIRRGTRYYESFQVGRWPLDEGSGSVIRDVSGNGNHGSLHGAPGWVATDFPLREYAHRSEGMAFGEENATRRALRFDGVEERVTSQSAVDLADRSFSVEFWARRERMGIPSVALAQTEGVRQDVAAFRNRALHIGWRGNDVFTFAFFGNDLNTTQAWNDTDWHHWACTYDRVSGARRIYRDGVLVAEDVSASAYQGGGPVWLGLRQFLPANDWGFVGQLRDVRIWGGALRRGTIGDWMDRTLSEDHPNLGELMAWWPLTATSGSIAVDGSPHRNRGTLFPVANGTRWTRFGGVEAAATGLTSGTTAQYRQVATNAYGPAVGAPRLVTTHRAGGGTAVRFDGGASSVRIGPYEELRLTNGLTLEAWVRPLGVSKNVEVLLIREGEYGLGRAADGTLLVVLATASPGWGWVPTEARIPWGEWTHVAVTYDGAQVRVFTHGAFAGAHAASGPIVDVVPSVNTLDLGATPLASGQHFTGELDEVRIWDRALPEERMARDYNVPLTGEEDGLVAHYRFDEGGGERVWDATARGLHGVLVGGVDHVPSGAGVGRALAITGPVRDLAFGSPILEGLVKTDGQAATAYFEWGPGTTRLPVAAENRVAFHVAGTDLATLGDVPWDSPPHLEDRYYTIDIPATSGAFWPGVPADRFGARFTGSLHVPTDGLYRFHLTSDDGSDLRIGGDLVVSHDGLHGMTEASGVVQLAAGAHPFEVRYFENAGAAGLVLAYEGPGIPRQTVPADAFTTRPPEYGFTTARTPISGLLAPQSISAALPELEPGVYQYRLVVEHPNGTEHGGNRSFTVTRPALGGAAIRFDGVNDYVQVGPDPATRATSALTVEAWIFPMGPGATGNGMIVNREGEYEIARLASGELWWAVSNGGRWAVQRTGHFAPLHQWTHVALVYQSGVVRIYANGELVQTSNGSGNIGDAHPDMNDFRIGGRQGLSNPFDGLIDDVRVWNVAVTQADLRDRMHRWLSGSEPGLQLYLRFDEGVGLEARSRAGGLIGTLTNGADWVTSGVEKRLAPEAETTGAQPALATSATLTGWVNGFESETVAWFTWWPADNPSDVRRGPNRAVGRGPFNVRLTEAVTGLAADTEYGFRLQASSGIGNGESGAGSFRTLLLDCGWPVAVQGTSGESREARHAVGATGDVLVAGRYNGSATFGSHAFTASPGVSPAFVAALDPAGEWQWARHFEASGTLTVDGVAPDSEGGWRVAGSFGGVLSAGAGRLTSDGPTSAFVARLNAAGEWAWALRLAGSGASRIHDLAMGPDGATFVVGAFGGTVNPAGVPVVSAGGTDVFIGRVSPNGEWEWLRSAGGAGDDRAQALALAGSDTIWVAGEFRNTATFGTASLVSAGGSDFFLARIDTEGEWVQAWRGGGAGEDRALDVAADGAGHVWLAGHARGAINLAGTSRNAGPTGQDNLFVARLDAGGSLLWFTQTGTTGPARLALDAGGDGYLLADFANNLILGTTSLVPRGGSRDLMLARIGAATGAWSWVEQVGGNGVERAGDLVRGPDGVFTFSGSFGGPMAVGRVNLVTASERVFLGRINAGGGFEYNTWTVGQAVPVPEAARRSDGGALRLPQVSILAPAGASWGDYFHWSQAEHRLYALRPVELAEISWPLSAASETEVLGCLGRSIWPLDPPRHVMGAPADLEPAIEGFPLRFQELIFTEASAVISNLVTSDGQPRPVFHAAQPGHSVLRFLVTEGQPIDLATQPAQFEVVRSVPWHDPGLFEDGIPAVVGQPVTHAGHDDPTGGGGYVMLTRAPVDMATANPAHRRVERLGPIVPVNTHSAASNDDLVVAWYRRSAETGIPWPGLTARYRIEWPDEVPSLVIGSAEGSGPLSPSDYPGKHVYRQPDPSLAGHNPNEEHAFLVGDTLHALRDDLNAVLGVSEPYVLLKFRMEDGWAFRLWRVAPGVRRLPGEAGLELALPGPFSSLGICAASQGMSGPYFEDHTGRFHARAAGAGGGTTEVRIGYFYPLREDFDYDLNRDGQPDVAVGGCVPWLDRLPGGSPGTPAPLTYEVRWPETVPTLEIGESLFDAKRGLPAIRGWARAEIVFDEGDPSGGDPMASVARLFDPLSERVFQLAAGFQVPGGVATANDRGRLVFPGLPYALRSRLAYDPLNRRLSFRGWVDTSGAGEPLLLLNIMTARERDRIRELSPDPAFRDAIDALYRLTRNPNRIDLDGDGVADDALLAGLTGSITNAATGVQGGPVRHEAQGDVPKVLSAGLGTGSGYVTLVENDHPDLAGLPVRLHLVRVAGGPFSGELKVIEPDNVFDERLTLRHSADFGGDPDGIEFEWYHRPDDGSDPTRLPVLTATRNELNGWTRLTVTPGNGAGVNEVTVGDGGNTGLLTLADHGYIVRYRGYAVDGATPWSAWAGAPGGDRGQLAEGWVKRVVGGLNPFEARTRDFHGAETATYASMIRQAGRRYEGDIPFNPAADSINSVGLIEAYETVLRRGRRLSIDAVPPVNFGPANDALLLAAGRIADLYLLLGNEAFADAADPTIGFPTGSSEYGSLASSIFAFQNQLDSLLEEELVLLRGRDNRSAPVTAPPVYNRLFWNFTQSDGEVAYVQTYNITDLDGPGGEPDGRIDEIDARSLFPQGHGDAWGHYLTATKVYYDLLANPHFDWVPRSESVLIANVPVEVDYLDERKFARAAALKSRTGAEIVDLTYRLSYVDDPAGQWQGYRDSDTDRAWGVTEWARRAGQAAYFDWVTASTVLPAVDPDPTRTGIRKIDRTTVSELDEIVAAYEEVQSQMDKADLGLNPMGLAKGVVPFDISPARIDQGLTHFEQIYERAVEALTGALTVFDHASQLSQSLCRNQDRQDEFGRQVGMRERDYKNRLIELFGYPYAGDIGAGGTYPSGYDGPDLYHYMYVDAVDLTGDNAPPAAAFTGYFTAKVYGDATLGHYFPDDVPGLQSGIDPGTLQVSYPWSAAGFGFVPPASWGARRAPGEMQLALSTLLQGETALRKALKTYDVLIGRIEDHLDMLQARYDLQAEAVRLRDVRRGAEATATMIVAAAKATQAWAKKTVETTRRMGQIAVEGVPRVVGLANDVTAPLRASLLLNAEILAAPALVIEGVAVGVQAAAEAAKSVAITMTESQLEAAEERYEVLQEIKVLEQRMREEAVIRLEVYKLREAVNQAAGEYLATQARGLRLIEERVAFRRSAAADTQTSRYRDMGFRIFRNDALQKYRAQFDLAQRYVFLAATAYDFETQTLGGTGAAGNPFLTEILRQRSLGQVLQGRPVTGEGLANTLAVLNQNFAVLKGRLGFNAPQTETGQFSLRRESLRIRDDGNETWRAELRRHLVPDLWALPEFRRYCRIFAPESDGPQPALVMRFPTTITSGLNFFGWPLSPGDTAYDPTLFSTKVRSVGVWFANYLAADLAAAPRVYLVPAGEDIVRTPASDNLATREWRIVDQKLPVPFPIAAGSLSNPSWIPMQDSFGSLGETYGEIQRFSSFRAYHDDGFSPAQVLSSDRLVGRSVWNTDWILIVPGATLLNNPDEGLDRFIRAVSDIKIYFQTYSFSGN